MPAEINVTSHMSLHTWSLRRKFFQNHQDDNQNTTHQDDNQNTHVTKILCILTFKVFQKHTFFSYKTFATNIAETSRRRTVLDRVFTPKQMNELWFIH